MHLFTLYKINFNYQKTFSTFYLRLIFLFCGYLYFICRWPVLKNICKRKWRNINVNYRQEVIEKMRSRKELLHFFSMLPDEYYYKEAISVTKMKYFDSLFRVEEGASPTKYYYLEYELQKFCEEPLK